MRGHAKMEEMVKEKVEEKKTKSEKKTTTKRRNYKKELEKALEENKILKEQMIRLAAEFDNYKKRIERERASQVDTIKAELIKELLPVIDDLERSVEIGKEKKDFDSLLEGISLVYKNFMKTLQAQGLKPLESVGKKFDPEKHDALMQVEVKGQKPDMVVDEHIKGYKFKDRIIRHAKVIVSK